MFIMFSAADMNDDALAKVMEKLEQDIGEERLSALRREAANRGTTVIKLLGDAVMSFADKLNNPTQSQDAA